jgi:ketosteroid isomerase-like protein
MGPLVLTVPKAAQPPLYDRPMLPEAAVGTRLVEAIAAQDVAAIASCFAADVQFRALVPPGLRERTGAPETASLIAGWFADSTELELVDSETQAVGDRLHVAYRFVGVEEGKPFIVDQHLNGTVRDGKITHADLLCSGFRPRGE